MSQGFSASQPDASAALRFLLDSGVDCFVQETARNWLVAPVAKPVPVAPPKPVEARAEVKVRATTLAALAAEVAAQPHPLNTGDMQPTLVQGVEEAALLVLTDTRMIEDSEAGRLVKAMLAAIGLSGAAAYLPLLPWPTPGGRAPRPEELVAFAPFSRAAVRLARPKLALALGPHVAAPLMGRAARAGDWVEVEGVPLLTTLSPALLLRTPALKAEAWAHLQSLHGRLA